MVQLTKIYTRGGDKGETSLGDGSRIAKHGLRVKAYGTVDEANAVIGLVRVEILRTPDIDDTLDPAGEGARTAPVSARVPKCGVAPSSIRERLAKTRRKPKVFNSH